MIEIEQRILREFNRRNKDALAKNREKMYELSISWSQDVGTSYMIPRLEFRLIDSKRKTFSIVRTRL